MPLDHACRRDDEAQPFGGRAAHMAHLEDRVRVFSSLQKPKRIGVVADDGRTYYFLCKKDDDLRKDARVVEFNTLINRLLLADSQARRRDLHVRTYSVVPLNETVGMLEWINNTVPLRSVLVEQYSKRGLWHERTNKEASEIYESDKGADARKQNFRRLLARFPSVLHSWFVEQFPDAADWLSARLHYTRSCAVMSMVGFVLGLGDRHSENMLFDKRNGDFIHIDLNCIFLKAETFSVPEKVRAPMQCGEMFSDDCSLLVVAAGAVSIDAQFARRHGSRQRGRRFSRTRLFGLVWFSRSLTALLLLLLQLVCEQTMHILRKHRSMLMSVLETLIYDPLVDWKKEATRRQTRQRSHTGGAGAQKEPDVNREGEKDLRTVENKLLGLPFQSKHGAARAGNTHGLAMSVEGHVAYLIKEATSDTNLSSMFVGWSSWI